MITTKSLRRPLVVRARMIKLEEEFDAIFKGGLRMVHVMQSAAAGRQRPGLRKRGRCVNSGARSVRPNEGYSTSFNARAA